MIRPGLAPRTVSDCLYRIARTPDDDSATCGFVAGLVGPGAEGRAVVGRDACRACCSTFPPTPDALNPVVASVLYSAVTGPAPPGLTPERLNFLKAAAGHALNADFEGQAVPPPAEGGGNNRRPLSEALEAPGVGRHGSVSTWAVGVTTAPRRESTLDRCLESLAAAGWDDPRLFIDSAVDLPPRASSLGQTYRDDAIGAWPNYLLTLYELVLRSPRADAYLIAQDDALFYGAEPLRPYLEREILWPGPRPGRSMLSLYCPSPYARPRAGWHTLRDRWAWGALAFIFPNALARAVLLDPTVFEHRWVGRSDGLAHIDVVIGQWALRKRIDIWYPSPSLVQHIGETSSLWEDARALGDRRALTFLGDSGPDLTPR